MTDGHVVVHRTMSLDGYIAGPRHEMDWIFGYDAPDRARDVMEATGAIVAGRTTFEVGERDAGKPSGGPYGGAWSGAIFVLTHRPIEPREGITVVSGDIREVVTTAREAAGGKNVEVFGAGVAAQAFAAGVVDDVIVHVAPVLLGDGIPFSPGSGRIELEPVARTPNGDVTDLRFRVRR
jgi:dihydrofolate reductase